MRMVSRAMRRCSFRVWSWESRPNSRWCSRSAASISTFYGDVVDSQPIRRLAFRLQEIFDAVFGHDARRLLRESAAQILGTLRKFLGHGL
jgi:hypothetical protein